MTQHWIRELTDHATSNYISEIRDMLRTSMGSTNVNDLLRDEELIEMFFHDLVYCRKGTGFDSPRFARRFLFMLKNKLGITSSFEHLIKIEQLITEHETLWIEVMIKELESDKPTITVRLSYRHYYVYYHT